MISYLVGTFVALCLSRLAFVGKTVLAFWELLKLPLLPGLYLGDVLLNAHQKSTYGAKYFPLMRAIIEKIDVEYYDGVVD